MDKSTQTNFNNLGSNSVQQQQQPVVGGNDAAYQLYYPQFVQHFDTLARNYSPFPGQIPPANLLVPMFMPPLHFLSPQMQAQMHQCGLTGVQYANQVPSGLQPQSQFMNFLLQQGNLNLYNGLNQLMSNQLNILPPNPLFSGPSLLNQPQVDMFTNQPNAGMNQPIQGHTVVHPAGSSEDLGMEGVDEYDLEFADEFEPAPLSDEEDEGLTVERIKMFEHFNANKSLVGEQCCVCLKDLKVR